VRYRFLPAKMREICRPRLKAVLNSSLVWIVETKGSQARTATGAKIKIPIPYSYVRAMALTESQRPRVLRVGLKTRAICKQIQEVVRNGDCPQNAAARQ
jgi:hypothetical protein